MSRDFTRHRDAVTDGGGGADMRRTRSRRYLQPVSGCLCCNRRRSWASARTRYLQWCPRRSRCNRRSGRRSLPVRSSLLNESSACAQSSLTSSRRRLMLTGRGRLRAGRPGVPDDGRRCDLPGPRRTRGSALAGGTAAPAAASARTGQAPKLMASGRYRPAPDRPPATRYRSVVTSSPARPLPSADITRTRVSPAAITRSRPLSRLRRRHVYAAEMLAYQALSANDLR